MLPSTANADVGAPRCKACAYTLTGLPPLGCCPECNREYNFDDPATYTTKPPFVGWKFWLPGLVTAVLCGTASAAFIAFAQGGWGWPLWVAVPCAAGCILGYRARVGGFVLAMLGLALLVALIFGLMSLSLAGVFCGLMLSGIFLGPIVAGLAFGAGLRRTLKGTSFSQQGYLPVLVIALIPVLLAAIDGPARPHPVVRISTAAVLDATPAECWEAIVFYEEVTHDPPLLLRIGLAHPLRTIGRAEEPGDVKVCIYNRGRIAKRVTEAVPGDRLVFEVIEQQIGYERDVRLIGGSFVFQPLGPERTRITLTTAYEPYLGPRFAWLPAERLAIRLLHTHVLEGMRQQAGTAARPPLAAAEGTP